MYQPRFIRLQINNSKAKKKKKFEQKGECIGLNKKSRVTAIAYWGRQGRAVGVWSNNVIRSWFLWALLPSYWIHHEIALPHRIHESLFYFIEFLIVWQARVKIPFTAVIPQGSLPVGFPFSCLHQFSCCLSNSVWCTRKDWEGRHLLSITSLACQMTW